MADLVQKMSNTHDDIMNVMVAHPLAGLSELALLTGYSVVWLSRLTNSDMFRTRLAEKKKEVFVHIAEDIPEKLNALGHQAIDKLADKLEASQDPDFALDTFDKVMKANGFAPGSNKVAGNVATQNNFFISREDLASARKAISSPPPEGRLIEQEIPSV